MPVIATDVGSVGGAVIDGATGLLVRPGRPDELAAAADDEALDAAVLGRA